MNEIVKNPNTFPELPINDQFVAGVDVGGTKVHIMDTLSTNVSRYSTADYPDMYAVLDAHFEKRHARPVTAAVAMAGPRDDETGAIKLTNSPWPEFDPHQAEERYPGSHFTTANDMVATSAGVLQLSSIDLEPLKPGAGSRTGTKLIMAVSTGVGSAAAVWDEHSQRNVFLAGEGGHIGFQPKDEEEASYLEHLHRKYPHASAELALSGKHGVENLVEHSLSAEAAPELATAIHKAKEADRPVGAVLLEFATQAQGPSQEAARVILGRMGAMLGSVTRDLTLAYKASGGIYLTGSVALALGEYLAEETPFVERFVHSGAVHDTWLEKTPINLVTNPNVAVIGALALAKV